MSFTKVDQNNIFCLQTPPIHRGNSPSPNGTCIVPAVQSLGNLNDACRLLSLILISTVSKRIKT